MKDVFNKVVPFLKKKLYTACKTKLFLVHLFIALYFLLLFECRSSLCVPIAGSFEDRGLQEPRLLYIHEPHKETESRK